MLSKGFFVAAMYFIKSDQVIMKFFIPNAKSDEQTKIVYDGVRQFLEQQNHKLSDACIQEIEFVRDGKTTIDTVGECSQSNGEIVVAIFDSEQMYLVCTYSRGVAQGGPMFTGKWQTKRVKYFDR